MSPRAPKRSARDPPVCAAVRRLPRADRCTGPPELDHGKRHAACATHHHHRARQQRRQPGTRRRRGHTEAWSWLLADVPTRVPAHAQSWRRAYVSHSCWLAPKPQRCSYLLRNSTASDARSIAPFPPQPYPTTPHITMSRTAAAPPRDLQRRLGPLSSRSFFSSSRKTHTDF